MTNYYDRKITGVSSLSAAQLNAYINPRAKNKGQSKMIDIGALLKEAELTTGLNAAFLAAVAAHESAWGSSNYALKYNSLFGYGAFDSDPDKTIELGGGATLREGVLKSAKGILTSFVQKRGQTTLGAVAQSYASDKNWINVVSQIWAALEGQTADAPSSGSGSTGDSPYSDSPYTEYPSGGSSSGPATPTSPMGDVYTGSMGGSYDVFSSAGRTLRWFQYFVQKGDTLASIATKYKTTVDFLAKWNGLAANAKLPIGINLRVYAYYVIEGGDTLQAIATDFGTSVNEIKKVNAYLEDKDVNIGLKVRLPEACIKGTPPVNITAADQGAGIGGDGGVPIIKTPVFGSAPSVTEDEYPPHRFADNPFALRIGDVQFFIPPTNIRVDYAGNVDSTEILRFKEPIQTKSGHTKKVLGLTLYFADTDQINGFQVKGPGGRIYYMDGLRPLIAQFIRTPFLPIRNELINARYHIWNVALQNISFSTVEGFPTVLACELSLVEFTQEPFTEYPDFFMDNLIMYPLFRWWYQQMLDDKIGNRLSSTYLRPVPVGMFRGHLGLRVLDRQSIEDIMAPTDGKPYDPNALAKLKIPDIRELMMDWPLEDITVDEVTVSLSKTLTPIIIDDHEIPTFQDLGGIQKEFAITLTCTDRTSLESITMLMQHQEELSREYRHRFVSGYIEFDNEVLNLAGIYHGMLIGMRSETIDGFDNEFKVTLYGKGMALTQKNAERFLGVNDMVTNASQWQTPESIAIDDKMNRRAEIYYESAMEEALRSIELYPDLELPTYDEVNAAISQINKLREGRGLSPLPMDKLPTNPYSLYVDPDFYFAYPPYERVFEELDLGDFGQKITNLVTGGNYTAMRDFASEIGWDDVKKFGEFALTKNWVDVQDDPKGMESLKASVNVKWENIAKKSPQAYYTQVGSSWAEGSQPTGELMLEMMCHDMKMYDKKGRMVRAFPTYLLLFVMEGKWVNGRKLWNRYFAYHAIHQIDIVKDKDNPADMAYVQLSNIYGAFDFKSRLSKVNGTVHRMGLWDRLKQMLKDFSPTIDDETIREHTEVLEQAKLQQGARVHIRLGYGSAAYLLPTVFNGHVAEINEGQFDVQLFCQGDGVELVNQMIGKAPGDKMPPESRNLFMDILCKRRSDFFFGVSDQFEFFNNYESEFGIEHFGWVESKAEKGGTGFVDFVSYVFTLGDALRTVTVNTYDVMKNIYRGTDTGTTTEVEGINPFDGEKNITLDIFQRTAWDIFQVHALFNPDFICSPHPHGFRSTLFFGKPHWRVKYGYELQSGKSHNPANPISAYQEKVKVFQQMHVITSGSDIIHNNIKASSEHIAHVAIGVYSKGAGAQTTAIWPMYADRSIRSEFQRTFVVDTMVTQNLLGFDVGYDFLKFTLGPVLEMPEALVGMLGDGLDKIIETAPNKAAEALLEATGFITMRDTVRDLEKKLDQYVNKDWLFQPGDQQAKIVTVGALQRKMQEMYQGELIIFGNPSMKPWDIMYLADAHKMLTGTCEVGKVTHSLGRGTGFITVIKPDLCVSRSEGKEINEVMQLFIGFGSFLTTVLTRKLMMCRFSKGIGKATGKGIMWTAGKVGGIFTKRIPGGVKTRVSRLTKLTQAKGLKALKGIGNMAKPLFVVGLVAGALMTWVEDIIKKNTAYNNCLYIYPLWKYDRPFVAGVTGALHLIPNYIEPEFLDAETLNKMKNSALKAPQANTPIVEGVTMKNGQVGVAASAQMPDRGDNSPAPSPVPTHKVVPPMARMNIRSGFGLRINPMTGKQEGHSGVDIDPLQPRKFGTPALAIADGVINKAAEDNGSGKYIWLDCNIDGKKWRFGYGHLEKHAVSAGQQVKAGQIVGYVGNTGNVRKLNGKAPTAEERKAGVGIHLHFTVRDLNGKEPKLIDPKTFFGQYGITFSNV